MKILHVIFTTDLGGAERYAAELASAQANADHEVRVLMRPQRGDNNLETLLDKNIQRASIHRFFQSWQVSKYIEMFEPEIIHCHLGKAAQLLGKIKPDIPTVATLHLGYKAKHYGQLDGLICIADWQNVKLGDYAGAVATIMNWTAPASTVVFDQIENLRSSWGADAKTFVVGTVGRLHKIKGYDVLIQAFKETQSPSSKLVIVGGGDEKTALARLVAGDENIILAGAQTQVAAYYAAFDVFVSASRSESFGLVILEAMAAGCRVIASKTEGALCILKGQPATLVDVDNVAELAQVLEKAASAGRSREKDYDMAPFNMLSQTQKIIAFYKTVIGSMPRER